MSGRIETKIENRGEGRVAFVTIDNRQKLNALGSELMEAFVAAVEACGRDGGLRAVIVSGAGGKAFVGGADILEMSGLEPAGARAFITRVHQCCQAVRDCPLPVVAAIDGHCYGAGLELAAACDIRLASSHARFGMQEVRLGIPSVVEAALLPQLIGWGRTRDLLLTGDVIGADEALRIGLVERLAPHETFGAALESLLNSLLAGGRNALTLQKKLITRWETAALPAAIEAGVGCFEEAFRSDEAQKLLGHFVAERAARKGAAAAEGPARTD